MRGPEFYRGPGEGEGNGDSAPVDESTESGGEWQPGKYPTVPAWPTGSVEVGVSD